MNPTRKAQTPPRTPRGKLVASAATPEPAGDNATRPLPALKGRAKKRNVEPMKNVTFYASSALIERAKNAQAATQYERRGHRSFTALVDAGLLAEAQRLERMYNSGEPFTPIPPGTIQRGRRGVRLRTVDTGLVHESFSQRPSNTNRARGTWLATRFLAGGYDSLTEMIVGGLEREVEQLERAYNSKQIFASRAAGALPSGRRPKTMPAPKTDPTLKTTKPTRDGSKVPRSSTRPKVPTAAHNLPTEPPLEQL